jgi:hypothetical protein
MKEHKEFFERIIKCRLYRMIYENRFRESTYICPRAKDKVTIFVHHELLL